MLSMGFDFCFQSLEAVLPLSKDLSKVSSHMCSTCTCELLPYEKEAPPKGVLLRSEHHKQNKAQEHRPSHITSDAS